MKTTILTLLSAPWLMHLGIHRFALIESDILRMLTWVILIIAMMAAFITSCAYFCRHR